MNEEYEELMRTLDAIKQYADRVQGFVPNNKPARYYAPFQNSADEMLHKLERWTQRWESR